MERSLIIPKFKSCSTAVFPPTATPTSSNAHCNTKKPFQKRTLTARILTGNSTAPAIQAPATVEAAAHLNRYSSPKPSPAPAHIESVFDFYKTEKEFLDQFDEGRPEDRRITDLISEVLTEMVPLSRDLDYQNKFLETFYRKAAENKFELILNSRQKRKLAAHFGIVVTEIMEQLRKCRDLPKVFAPKKKITKQSEIVSRPENLSESKFEKNHSQSEIPKFVQPEKQLNPFSVEIAGEESFWGSLAELEPTETIADREAAVELVEKEKKKRLDELTRTETYLEKYQKQIAKPYQPKYTKNGGCNHMTCTNKSCKSEFCWLCMGCWRSHGTSGYQCNWYDKSKDANQSKHRAYLNRFLFYYNTYL